MARFKVIQGGPIEGRVDPRGPQAVDGALRRRLAALRRPLSLVGGEASPIKSGRPARPARARRPGRPVPAEAQIGVRPEVRKG